jgi:carboxylate-amine ligase
LVQFVDDDLDQLGSRAEVEHIYRILDQGTDADRQLEVFKESGGDVKAVVDHILAQTMVGVPERVEMPLH